MTITQYCHDYSKLPQQLNIVTIVGTIVKVSHK